VLNIKFISGRLPHRHKIVIAGNHELSFDPKFAGDRGRQVVESIPELGYRREVMTEAVKSIDTKKRLTNCIYLEDSGIQIWGISIYGTPW
jgi:hypothetical protein